MIGLTKKTDTSTGDRQHPKTLTAQRESSTWLKSYITTIQATHQLAHVYHSRAGDRTLPCSKDMQGTAALNTSTSHEIADDDKLTTTSGLISTTSLRRLKHYKELHDKAIDIYLSQICNQLQKSRASASKT